MPTAETADQSSPSVHRENRRRLAILAADVSGYTRLMNVDEHATHARFMELTVEIVFPTIVSHRGHVVKHTGDGFIATFESPLDAVRCAAALQIELRQAEARVQRDRRILFRMGLHEGEVIREEHDVFGNHVNIAARLQSHAEPGGILISDALRGVVERRTDLVTEPLGELELKNITGRIGAHAIRLPHGPLAGAEELPLDLERPARSPSIAILPFREPGAPSDAEYFGDGIAENIAASLANLQDLLVVSVASTLAYRGTNVDLRQVSSALGVGYVVTGSVQRRNGRLRILVELNESVTSRVLWGKRYEGEYAHIFELQDRITLEVVGSIMPQIRVAELRRAMTKKPENMDAYDYFLRGIDLLRGRNAAEFPRARHLLGKAIEADPLYVPAYSYAAFWHIRNVAQGWSTDAQMDTREAERLSATAVGMDAGYALGLALHAHCRSFLNKDHEGGRALLDQAVALSPNNSMALVFSSSNHSYLGQAEEAIADAQKAIRLSPVDSYAFFFHETLSMAHLVAGSFDEAVVWSYRAFRENPQFAGNLRLLAVSLVALGRAEEARRIGASLLDVDPKFRVGDFERRLPYVVPAVRELFLRNLRLAGLPD